MDHDLQTQEAMARVLGSRRWETRTITSHGGGGGSGGGREFSPSPPMFSFQCLKSP